MLTQEQLLQIEYLQQAEDLYKQGSYPAAERVARQVLDIYQQKQHLTEHKKVLYYYQALLVVAESLLHQGLAKEALLYAEECLQLGIELLTQENQVRLYTCLGGIATRLSKSSEAMHYYYEGLRLAAECGDTIGEAALLTNIGVIFFSLLDYERSLENFYKALELHEQVQHIRGVITTLGNLAKVYSRLANNERALEYHLQAVEYAQHLENEDILAIQTLQLGTFYLDVERFDEALQYLEKAQILLVKTNNMLGEAVCVSNLSILYFRKDMMPESYALCCKALELYESLHNYSGIVRKLTQLAEIHDFNERYKDEQQAEAYLEKAMKLAQDHSLRHELLAIYQHKRKFHEKRQEWQEAYLMLENLQQLEKQVYSEEAKTRADKYAYERQISLMEKEREVTQKYTAELQAQHEEIVRQHAEIQAKTDLLRSQNQQLATALEQLQELTDLKDFLTSTLVHDIKNPVGIIIQLAQAEANTSIHAPVILKTSKKLLSLTLNLLEIPKIQSAQLQLMPQTHNVADIINTATEDIFSVFQNGQIQTRIHIQSGDIYVLCERYMIERVISNLLLNAISYTEKGTITIGTQQAEREEDICFFVQDTGKGIAKDKLQYIFKAQRQIETSLAGDKIAPSTGIGLQFCNLAISAHGGKIWMESEVDKGTTVYFTLPRSTQTVNRDVTILAEQEQKANSVIGLTQEEKEYVKNIAITLVESNLKIYQFSELMDILDRFAYNSIALQRWRLEIEEQLCSMEHDNFTNMLQEIIYNS